MTKRYAPFVLVCMLLLSVLMGLHSQLVLPPVRTVLVLGTANGWTDWTAVESHINNPDIRIVFANLDGFGDTMQQHGFQAAIDQHDQQLQRVVGILKPAALVVASKGLNVLTHLILTGVHVVGPVVLLSPIPNSCKHIPGQTWLNQWAESLRVMKERGDGNETTIVGVGTSRDEQSLIVEHMNETGVCGDLLPVSNDWSNQAKAPGDFLFQRCSNWYLRSFSGDHFWKNDAAEVAGIASLIEMSLETQQHKENAKLFQSGATPDL